MAAKFTWLESKRPLPFVSNKRKHRKISRSVWSRASRETRFRSDFSSSRLPEACMRDNYDTTNYLNDYITSLLQQHKTSTNELQQYWPFISHSILKKNSTIIGNATGFRVVTLKETYRLTMPITLSSTPFLCFAPSFNGRDTWKSAILWLHRREFDSSPLNHQSYEFELWRPWRKH